MKKRKNVRLICLFSVLGIISACAKPASVETIKSPSEGLFYTLEYFNGRGPADSDFTKVYAHFMYEGESDKALVLDGTNLTISQITWDGPHDVTICVQRGWTNTFHNEINLMIGRNWKSVHNHLRENC